MYLKVSEINGCFDLLFSGKQIVAKVQALQGSGFTGYLHHVCIIYMMQIPREIYIVRSLGNLRAVDYV